MPIQAVAKTNATPQKISNGRIVDGVTPPTKTAHPPSRVENLNTNKKQGYSTHVSSAEIKNGEDTPRRVPRPTRIAPQQSVESRRARFTRTGQQMGRMALQGAINPNELRQNIVQSAQGLANKLNREIEMGNDTGAFMIALSLAMFKDFLDIVLTFTGLGLIPGVNFAIGLFLSSFLFFFMLGKGWMRKWRLKIKFWVLGLFFDGLPLFSALPINSLLVIDAWRHVRKRAQKAGVHMRDLSKLTQREIEALHKDIGELDNA